MSMRSSSSEKVVLKVQRLTPSAILPMRGTPRSAGLDLYALENVTIVGGHVGKIRTGLKMEIPEGYYGQIKSKSGLSINHHLNVRAGVIDEDYRGEIIVLLMNEGIHDFEITVGMKTAQIIIQPYSSCPVEEVTILSDTSRGEGRFGSTGV